MEAALEADPGNLQTQINVAIVRNNFAQTLRLAGKLDEAESLSRLAIAGLAPAGQQESLPMASMLNNLAPQCWLGAASRSALRRQVSPRSWMGVCIRNSCSLLGLMRRAIIYACVIRHWKYWTVGNCNSW
jgi:hypothetical protein